MQQLKDGSYTSKQKEVYALVEAAGASDIEQLRSACSIPHQTLTSRLSSLMDMGVIAQDHEDRFCLVHESRHEHMAKVRTDFRYMRWVNKGRQEGFFERLANDHMENLNVPAL